jgi:hypothetical protein
VPYFNSVSLSRTNLIVAGTNGPHSGNYYVLTNASLTAPLANWTRLSTNPFDTSGNFRFTNAVSPGQPALFYLLQLQ